MYTKDQLCVPPQSAWFESINSLSKRVRLQDSVFYQKDLIGLKKLDEETQKLEDDK